MLRPRGDHWLKVVVRHSVCVGLQDEMLIFMEYCAEGTIEEVAKQGLPEAMVRRYTSELLVAVGVLHDHSIVHRDIKGQGPPTRRIPRNCQFLGVHCGER